MALALSCFVDSCFEPSHARRVDMIEKVGVPKVLSSFELVLASVS